MNAKCFEEEWEVNGPTIWMENGTPNPDVLGSFPDEARARLAAQAPKMAKEILFLAGFNYDGTQSMGQCSGCEQSPKHRPNCILVRLLRDAGVLP